MSAGNSTPLHEAAIDQLFKRMRSPSSAGDGLSLGTGLLGLLTACQVRAPEQDRPCPRDRHMADARERQVTGHQLARFVPPARLFDKHVYSPWTSGALHPYLRSAVDSRPRTRPDP